MSTDLKMRLVTAIRSWIHMDNLAESFQQQTANARTLRNTHETDAIGLMKQLGLGGSTIQVSGAHLQIARRKSQTGLSWTYLDREVPAWAASSGLTPAQSTSLLSWLREHRGTQEAEFLKKTGVGIKATDTKER